MSGTMMPPGGMPMGGAPQQGQIPPQLLQALMAQRQQQSSEVQEAIRTAIENHYSPYKGVRYAPPVGPRSDVDYQQKHPGDTVPIDVAHMVMGMQRARAGQPQPGMLPQMPSGAPPPMGGPGMPSPPVPGQPPMPQGAPQMSIGGAAAQNPNLAMFGQVAQMGQPGSGPMASPGQPRLTPAEMGHMGRYGDQMVGHLTPGEIQVPPELQSPKVLAVLDQAFHHAGVNPQQFEAGSPQSSVNPQTGAPEYSLWASLLPVLGAVGGGALGSVIPGVGTAIGAGVGGAVGGGVGGAVDHTGGAGIALGALGGGVGGYLGGVGAGAAGAAGAAAPAVDAGTWDTGAAAAQAGGSLASGATAATPYTVGPYGAATSAGAAQGMGGYAGAMRMGMGAGMGAGIGQAFAPQPQQQPQVPAGFNTPMNPVNPAYAQQRPTFAGYNPQQSVTSGTPYNFFPTR